MREIILDTETTGLYPEKNGDKHYIIEIGALEVQNLVPTGKLYHTKLKPKREIPEESTRIHGITMDMVQEAPYFKDIVHDLLDFIQDSPLVMHNAPFDMGFINAELKRIDMDILPLNQAVDTLMIARKVFPGQRVNLDALCRLYDIDLSQRIKHSALLDAKLLAEVYVNLKGGKQTLMNFKTAKKTSINVKKKMFPKRNFPILEENYKNHQKFLKDNKISDF